MSTKISSVLVISPSAEVHDQVTRGLSAAEFETTCKQETFTGMNGTAAKLAAQHNFILFDWDHEDPGSLDAARDMCERRAAGSKFVALASEDISLSKSRELARVGVDEVMPRSALKEEVIPHLKAWRDNLNLQLPSVWTHGAFEGKVIIVSKARGGVGASLLAANLANELLGTRSTRRKDRSNTVALVDLDLQFGNLASLMDVAENDAMWQIAMEDLMPDSVFMEQALVKSRAGVSVLTAPTRFGPLGALTAEQIGATLDTLKLSHDYVVVDMPGALVEWIDPVLSRASMMLLATDVTVPSVRSARKLLDFYLSEHPGLNIELVATRETKPLVQRSHHRAAASLLKKPFEHWLPDDPKLARTALDRGESFSAIAPRAKLSKSVRLLASKIMKDLPPRHVS
ncbi:hypothetical protein HKCCE3408_00955 [Rhodobacterales bacterium HKCCE3408]|nr:hypothetical protein [Rhodobacterales bacterium HKCCE3408]